MFAEQFSFKKCKVHVAEYWGKKEKELELEVPTQILTMWSLCAIVSFFFFLQLTSFQESFCKLAYILIMIKRPTQPIDTAMHKKRFRITSNKFSLDVIKITRAQD